MRVPGSGRRYDTSNTRGTRRIQRARVHRYASVGGGVGGIGVRSVVDAGVVELVPGVGVDVGIWCRCW